MQIGPLLSGISGSEAQLHVGRVVTELRLACVVPEQCSCSERSERAERSERSEHVWPQIVRNIWPTLAKIHPKLVKICQNHQSQHVEIWGCQF